MRISDWSSDVCSSDLVERGVVDHKFRAIDEGEELVGDRGELRLVGEELQGQAGDFLRAGLELALGMDVLVVRAAGGPALDQLHAADLDDAVALLPFKAGGFGVEDDLAHGLESWVWNWKTERGYSMVPERAVGLMGRTGERRE